MTKSTASSDSTPEPWPVEIIRSQRRRKTVSAKLENGTLVVRAPAAISDEELAPIIDNLRQRVRRKAQLTPHDDQDLAQLAEEINRKYFRNKLSWESIRYVTNQQKRYGSCTPERGAIRISHRVASLPDWVRRYVVMHELAHLREPNHGARFWKLVNRYPLTERARGYLMALDMEKVSGEQ